MECDEDQGIDENGKPYTSHSAIVKEARAVYNQLKMLHLTLKGNHDGDSGMISMSLIMMSSSKMASLY